MFRFYKVDPALQIMFLLTCSKFTLITLQNRNTQDSDSIENQHFLYKMVVSNIGVDPICRGIFTRDSKPIVLCPAYVCCIQGFVWFCCFQVSKFCLPVSELTNLAEDPKRTCWVDRWPICSRRGCLKSDQALSG